MGCEVTPAARQLGMSPVEYTDMAGETAEAGGAAIAARLSPARGGRCHRRIGGGRVPAREILISNAAVSNLIREGKTHQLMSTIQTGKKLGMMSLNESLCELVDKKLVEPEEAYVKAADKASMHTMLKQRGITLDVKQ